MHKNQVLVSNSLGSSELITATNSSWRLFLLQALGIVFFGALATMGKKASLNLGIPGHSALFWLTAIFAGRMMINRDGAGLMIGISTALWGVPLGLNHSLIHNVGMYGSVGVSLDILSRIELFSFRNVFGAIISGIIAHEIKFIFIIGRAIFSPVTKKFLLWGVFKASMLHLFFGALAGGIAFIGFCTIQELINKATEKPL